MRKDIIDIVDIKKAVTNGEIFFYVKQGFSDKGTVDYIYCKNDCGECVKVGEILGKAIEIWKDKDFIKLIGQEEKAKEMLDLLPTVKMSEDCISRNAITQTLNKMDRYVADELTLCDTDNKFPQNEVFIVDDVYEEIIEQLPSVKPQPKSEDMGEVSDGHHTFNQLYHQRAILFATIVNQNKERAWKSYKHEDRKYCFDKDGEWFIVGIDTPLGSYTYHYSKEYWDYFDCEELECGKPWDGHTEEDVTRLLSLLSVTSQPKRGHWIIDDKEYNRIWHCHCSNCKKDPQDYIGGTENWWLVRLPDYCPNCGADMRGDAE